MFTKILNKNHLSIKIPPKKRDEKINIKQLQVEYSPKKLAKMYKYGFWYIFEFLH